MHRLLILGLIVLSGLALTACRTAPMPMGSGDDTYLLQRHFDHWDVWVRQGVKPTHAATLKGLSELGLTAEHQQVDALSGIVRGRLADGAAYTITIRQENPELSLMAIRVGVFGNDDTTRRLFEAIRKHL